MRRGQLVIMGAAVGVAVMVRLVLGYAELDGLSDQARAIRLLRFHGELMCTPKIVDRPEEGVLLVVCADGKHRFVAQPSCDESLACELGIDVACWDHAAR